MKTKLCKSCKRHLNLDKFSPSKIIKDGYENKCRECRNEQRKNKHKLICECCGKSFKSAKKTNKYCSRECSGLAKRKRVINHCEWCNNEFETIESRKNNHIYCSSDCRSKSFSKKFNSINNPNYKRMSTKCNGCDKDILVTPSRVKKQKYIFCSNACYIQNIGKYYTGELNANYNHIIKKCSTCQKDISRTPSQFEGKQQFCSSECKNVFLKQLNDVVSENAKVICDCEYCGKKITRKRSATTGKKFIFCSMICKDKHQSEFYVGANHPSYDKNIPIAERIIKRNYNDYRNWRKQVYERDNYTCQSCFDNKGGNLVAHHILNYSSNKHLRTEIHNGITLCKSCHTSFHNYYGYRNNTKEQLQEFLNNSMLISSQD